MGTATLTVQNKWCNGLNSCQLQLFLEEARLKYDDDDDDDHHHHHHHLVNKTNLVHTLFLVYLSISTCFERLRAHHQGEQLCAPCIPDSHLHRITSTKCRINTAIPPDDGPGAARNM